MYLRDELARREQRRMFWLVMLGVGVLLLYAAAWLVWGL